MNKHGLYSKAAQIVRSLPQERGTAEQMVAAAKRVGLKDAELQNAGPLPEGKVTREELAKHFESKLPNMYVSQYGENPRFLTRDEGKRFMELQMRSFGDNLSPEEKREFDHLRQRNSSSPHVVGEDNEDGLEDTQYGDYALSGGKNYRERLIQLNKPVGKPREYYEVHTSHPDYVTFGQYETLDEAQLAADEFYDRHNGDYKTTTVKRRYPDTGSYYSSHWSGHPNVLAHIRMSDRVVGGDREDVRPIAGKLADAMGTGIRDLSSGSADYGVKNGVITPEEAATLSRFMGWRNNGYDDKPGLDKKLLHVEELQSDWGQEGRDQGFSDPENPHEIFNTKTGEVISRHPTYEAMWDAFRAIPEDQAAGLDYGKSKAPPAAPYVTNTQHWTDLALKNVLREAALGNYDGIVFTPGQAQADRYGLEKQVDSIKYWPEDRTLSALQGNSTRIAKQDVGPEDLPSLIGKELSKKLLHPSSIRKSEFDGSQYHMLQGEDMKVGGGGMKGYYDNIVPKSVMRLAQQHDPEVRPGEPVELPQGYQGFHLPMTDKLKSSILDQGFPAFRRGGAV